MSQPPESSRSSVLQSPWYWVYVFCTAGLIGLLVAGPKMLERQLQEERSYQGRARAAEQEAGQTPTTAVSTRENMLMSLRPLFAALAAGVALAWIVIWWQHFRFRKTSISTAIDKGASS